MALLVSISDVSLSLSLSTRPPPPPSYTTPLHYHTIRLTSLTIVSVFAGHAPSKPFLLSLLLSCLFRPFAVKLSYRKFQIIGIFVTGLCPLLTLEMFSLIYFIQAVCRLLDSIQCDRWWWSILLRAYWNSC
jgi:hypothetical protein